MAMQENTGSGGRSAPLAKEAGTMGEGGFDPDLVERVARVICHPHHHAIAAGRFACYLCEPRILAVLTAVAPSLRAEGAQQVLSEVLHDEWADDNTVAAVRSAVARIEKEQL